MAKIQGGMMAQQAKWDVLAGQIEDARRGGFLLPACDPGALPAEASDCYYVQDRSIALSGFAPRAWKLGAPTLAGQAAMGLAEPFAGPVLPGMLLASPAVLDVSGFATHKFEPEVAITLGADIDRAIAVDEARAAIAAYHPAIEIINFRIANGAALGAKAMLTDLGGNGALILGPAMAGEVFDYGGLTLDVRVNGASVAGRNPPPPETDPAALLAWFSGHITARGYALKAGDVITTGSQAGLLAYAPGDFIEADFGGAGAACVQC